MYRLLILLIWFTLASCQSKENVKVTHVFAMMGQSNMVGPVDERYSAMEVNSRIKVFSLNDEIIPGRYDLYVGPTKYSDYNVNIGIGSGISFANIMLTQYDSNDEIVLIPCARGASSMREQIERNATNPLFGVVFPNSLLETCIARINNLLQAVNNARYEGTLYYQGETDALFGNQEDYWKSGILHIIESINSNFGSSRFVFAQLSRLLVDNTDTLQKWDSFKYQQYLFSMDTDIPMIVTDDLNMLDNIHIDADSQQIVGERFARSYIDAFINDNK